MMDEIKNQYALYFVQDKINRFTVRIAIRIHSPNINKVSIIHSKAKTAEAMNKILAKNIENTVNIVQSNENNGASSSNNRASTKGPSNNPSFLKPVFGHLLEPYCAYEQRVEADDAYSHVTTGFAPYNMAKDKTNFLLSLCGRTDDFSCQEKPQDTDFHSLFSRYKIANDIIVQESEISLKLKTP